MTMNLECNSNVQTHEKTAKEIVQKKNTFDLILLTQNNCRF